MNSHLRRKARRAAARRVSVAIDTETWYVTTGATSPPILPLHWARVSKMDRERRECQANVADYMMRNSLEEIRARYPTAMVIHDEIFIDAPAEHGPKVAGLLERVMKACSADAYLAAFSRHADWGATRAEALKDDLPMMHASPAEKVI